MAAYVYGVSWSMGFLVGPSWQKLEKTEPPMRASKLLANLAEPKKVLPGSRFDELAPPAKIDISGLSSCKSVQKSAPQRSMLSAEARAFVPPSSVKVPSDR
eukprot:3989511-Amphidinium_carterae.1